MAKAQPLRLMHAQLRLRDGAYLAGKADLAEDDGLRPQEASREARRHRDADAEIRCRLVDADAARDLHVDIAGADLQVDALLEHGEQELDALDVDGV